MSIAPPVGAMSAYLARLVLRGPIAASAISRKRMAKILPRALYEVARRTEEYARGMATGGTLFEELGFYYVGPIDGHNLDHLIPVLKNVRDTEDGPGAGPCGDPEGPWLCARPRPRPTSITAWSSSTS